MEHMYILLLRQVQIGAVTASSSKILPDELKRTAVLPRGIGRYARGAGAVISGVRRRSMILHSSESGSTIFG